MKNKFFPFASIKFFILFFGFKSFAQAPKISSFTPTTVCQGDSVTINRTNFTGATSVTLGTATATSFRVKDDKTIVAFADKEAKSGNVLVTTSQGLSNKLAITINQAPDPEIADVSTAVDIPFTNCDGNSTYQLTVKNISSNIEKYLRR